MVKSWFTSHKFAQVRLVCSHLFDLIFQAKSVRRIVGVIGRFGLVLGRLCSTVSCFVTILLFVHGFVSFLVHQISYVFFILLPVGRSSLPHKGFRTAEVTAWFDRFDIGTAVSHHFKIIFLKVQIFQFQIELMLLGFNFSQLIGNNFACFVGFNIESLEIKDDAADIVLKILSHFLFSAEGHFVLVYLFNQLFLSFTGQVMDMTFDFFDSPCNFDLQVSVLRFQLHNFRLQIGYLIAILNLLHVEIFYRPDLIEIFLQGLDFLFEMLIGGVQKKGIFEFAGLLAQNVDLLVQVEDQSVDGFIADGVVLFCNRLY